MIGWDKSICFQKFNPLFLYAEYISKFDPSAQKIDIPKDFDGFWIWLMIIISEKSCTKHKPKNLSKDSQNIWFAH